MSSCIGGFRRAVAVKAHVVNGKIVVDEPVDLPDRSEVRIAQADSGNLIDAADVLDDLNRS